MNDTILKFKYPQTLIKKYNWWVLLMRPEQTTLGSLVLAYIPDVASLSEVNSEGFIELGEVIKEIETVLKRVFAYDKINYLTLMMVDKNVHMHIIPRYSNPSEFKQIKFFDYGWPGVPNLQKSNQVNVLEFQALTAYLKSKFDQV